MYFELSKRLEMTFFTLSIVYNVHEVQYHWDSVLSVRYTFIY